MRSSLIALATIGAAHATALTNDDFEFLQFITKYGKSYATVEEFNYRANLFKSSAAKIRAINSQQSTHVAGHNKMSDWTHEEYTKLLGLKDMPIPNLESVPKYIAAVNSVPANDIDWRNNGAVSAVKD